MKEKFSLKDALFNATKIAMIAREIKEVYPSFEQEKFQDEVLLAFPNLELKARISHIALMFKKYLPSDFQEATNILLQALPPELDPNKTDDDFGDFIYAPHSDFVVLNGCTQEHLAFSLGALREMTKRFSVEYAIRDFINHFPLETFEMLEACTVSENYHERRLASEGSRLKLPWAKKLTIAYDEPIKLLDKLYFDPTRYVTRSVANHLNDIAKLDAPLVLKTLKAWKNSKKQNEKEMEFLISHALRTLVKEGNVEALELLGYASNPKIEVSNFRLESKEVSVGEALNFSLNIEAKEPSRLMVDYVIFFQTKSGSLTAKVHKLKKLELKKGEAITLNKKHLFKVNMSTRKLYEGQHKVALQINGKMFFEDEFMLWSKQP